MRFLQAKVKPRAPFAEMKDAKSAAPRTSGSTAKTKARINFDVNCRTDMIPLDGALTTTMRTTEESGRGKGSATRLKPLWI